MRRSTDRILTTHVGALERPPELAQTLAEQGQWAPAALDQLRAGVAGRGPRFRTRLAALITGLTWPHLRASRLLLLSAFGGRGRAAPGAVTR